MIKIHTNGSFTKEEVDLYVEDLKKRHPDKRFTEISFSLDGDEVVADYKFESVEFERIRRITGYLVGTLDRFNDAKKAEVEDRVKHL